MNAKCKLSDHCKFRSVCQSYWVCDNTECAKRTSNKSKTTEICWVDSELSSLQASLGPPHAIYLWINECNAVLPWILLLTPTVKLFLSRKFLIFLSWLKTVSCSPLSYSGALLPTGELLLRMYKTEQRSESLWIEQIDTSCFWWEITNKAVFRSPTLHHNLNAPCAFP